MVFCTRGSRNRLKEIALRSGNRIKINITTLELLWCLPPPSSLDVGLPQVDLGREGPGLLFLARRGDDQQGRRRVWSQLLLLHEVHVTGNAKLLKKTKPKEKWISAVCLLPGGVEMNPISKMILSFSRKMHCGHL